MSAEDGSRPADTLRGRAGASSVKLWVLIEARRTTVVAVLFAGLVVLLVAVGVATPGALAALRSGDPVETVFQALVGATITGVTLVLTLNQLVLSQELGAVGDQRERMEGALSFRADVADLLDEPASPPEPASFLRALVAVSRDRVETFRDGLPGDAPSDLRDAADELADDVATNADEVVDQLGDAEFGTFDVVSAALNYDYSWKLYSARRIRAAHGDALGAEASDALDELVDVLAAFGPAREHFKTLYVQWELVNLSRAILASAVPALLTAIAVPLYVDPLSLGGNVAGVPYSVALLAVTVSVSVLPFVVLAAYVLRIATITKRTLSIGPFALRRTDGTDEGGRD